MELVHALPALAVRRDTLFDERAGVFAAVPAVARRSMRLGAGPDLACLAEGMLIAFFCLASEAVYSILAHDITRRGIPCRKLLAKFVVIRNGSDINRTLAAIETTVRAVRLPVIDICIIP